MRVLVVLRLQKTFPSLQDSRSTAIKDVEYIQQGIVATTKLSKVRNQPVGTTTYNN